MKKTFAVSVVLNQPQETGVDLKTYLVALTAQSVDEARGAAVELAMKEFPSHGVILITSIEIPT